MSFKINDRGAKKLSQHFSVIQKEFKEECKLCIANYIVSYADN